MGAGNELGGTMSESDEFCELGSRDLLPEFSNALVRLTCLYESLERTLSRGEEATITIKERVFCVLDQLYAELREATWRLDDHPERAEVKTRHVQAFRALAGRYVWQAPFFRHAYEKPRGYAGDFEMMEMLYDSQVEGATPFARLLQEHFMPGPGHRSVRSRHEYLRSLLVSNVIEGRARRLLSVASGSAGEVRDFFASVPDAPVEVSLLDRDAEALAFAMTALNSKAGASDRVRTLRMSVRDIAAGALKQQPPFDLIYSTGLYDYLNQRLAVALTRQLVESVAPGGEVLIANYAKEHVNPDRFIVEYAQDWFLVTRDEGEMYDLVASLDVEDCRLDHDPATGSIHFLTARRRR